jgi:hypothetical protein
VMANEPTGFADGTPVSPRTWTRTRSASSCLRVRRNCGRA